MLEQHCYYKGILIIIFGIHTRCQQMKVGVVCRKFACREDIHCYYMGEKHCWTFNIVHIMFCNGEATKLFHVEQGKFVRNR